MVRWKMDASSEVSKAAHNLADFSCSHLASLGYLQHRGDPNLILGLRSLGLCRLLRRCLQRSSHSGSLSAAVASFAVAGPRPLRLPSDPLPARSSSAATICGENGERVRCSIFWPARWRMGDSNGLSIGEDLGKIQCDFRPHSGIWGFRWSQPKGLRGRSRCISF
jgi:hypothetical protein